MNDRKELTTKQQLQVCNIHQLCYELMRDVLGTYPEWDQRWITKIAEVITEIAVEHFDRSEMEIYPYTDYPLPSIDDSIFDDVDHATSTFRYVWTNHQQGYPPGSFAEYLIKSFITADGNNFKRLAAAYPAYATAYRTVSGKGNPDETI